LGGPQIAGGKMKAIGTIQDGTGLWNSINNATNESGFSALPGGYRANSIFYEINNRGFWWSSSEFSLSEGWEWNISSSVIYIEQSQDLMNSGSSVRCVKD
jgi:uncharacterized protein (TIGR02145 family)